MAVEIPFRRDFECVPGELVAVSPLIRRMVAPNPSPFSFKGTNSYVIGHGSVALLDPGPSIDAHVEALLGALGGEQISHLVITHTHLDHSPAARLIKERRAVDTYAYGPHAGGRFEAGAKVEEGGDGDFRPDHELRHGDVIEGDGWRLRAVHTPGHTSNHLCYALDGEGALFTGDHVMGWSTSVVSPPDGDMEDYLASLDLLLARADRIYWPGHGPAIEDTGPYVRAFIAHRAEREEQILAALAAGPSTIADMVPGIYGDLHPGLVAAAGRSTFAAMIKLLGEGRVAMDGEASLQATYHLAD
jgi:glyoxylase-like metal-dependent hydrolase (beta-lactamase superfamily II)